MRLIPVDGFDDTHLKLLYQLLEERPTYASISHKEMPTYPDHCLFVQTMVPSPDSYQEIRLGHPRYQGWFLIKVVGCSSPVGTIYLTRYNEIGISLFNFARGRGYATQALKELMAKYGPARYLAHIAPTNPKSREIFEKLGFRHIQNTFECWHAG